jgi:Mating-type protein beta 1/Homeobox KN domain
MDEDIRRRLLTAEGSFLAALLSDPESIDAFCAQWHVLLQDWNENSDTLEQETLDLANKVSHRIALLAGDFTKYQANVLSMTDGLDDDVATICDSFRTDTAPSPSLHKPDKVLPATWLLQNLHNPYPSQTLRESMEVPVDSTAKSVSDWFAKARQRIGWTGLVRDRFGGSRAAATEAAFRAYVRDDSTNPLDSESMTAFLAIKSHAALVFAQNTSPGNDQCPGRSRCVSPTPSLMSSLGVEDSDEDSEEDVSSPTVPLAGQKRSTSHPLVECHCYPDDRPSKRPRLVQ